MFVTAIALVSFHAKVVWTPKTDLLPPGFVRAANFLLNHGLEDPRGCELKVATYKFHVPVMNRGYAWIRPDQSSDDRTVINAYGVKVEATKIGGMVFGTFLPRLRPESENGFPSHIRFNNEDALELVMLAIHGEEKLVSRQLDLVVKAHSGNLDRIPMQALQGYKAALYHVSLHAFKYGDYENALKYINEWLGDMPEFEKVVPLICSSPSYMYSEETKTDRSYFRISGETPGIRTELLTRVRNRLVPTITMKNIAALTIHDQVPLLIEKLAELGGHGESDFYFNSNVYRRIKEIGLQAVPALLGALKGNERITRLGPLSYTSRSLSSPLQFITVKSIVRQILHELGNTHNQLSDDQLIAYWEKRLSKGNPRALVPARCFESFFASH